jgi:DNA-binding NarL/FixJ family response regulator
VKQFDNLMEVLGRTAAEKLVAEYGGTRIYVPVRAVRASALASVIGLPAAEAFSRYYGGDRCDVPNPPTTRRQHVLELRRRGMRTAQIARELRCTVQWVRRLLAAAEDQ